MNVDPARLAYWSKPAHVITCKRCGREDVSHVRASAHYAAQDFAKRGWVAVRYDGPLCSDCYERFL